MDQFIPLLFQQRHVLPGGRMPIRITQGPQMEALKASLASSDGFGVCMFDEAEHGHHFFHIGTRVTVEDFDVAENNNTLIVTVYGHQNFRINALEQTDDGIFYGECEAIPLWPEVKIRNDQQILADKLQQMFVKHPELNRLHRQKEFNNLSWLCQRWLEILPVPASEKQALLNTPNCFDTYDYLMSIMHKPH